MSSSTGTLMVSRVKSPCRHDGRLAAIRSISSLLDLPMAGTLPVKCCTRTAHGVRQLEPLIQVSVASPRRMFPASCGGDYFFVLAIHEAVNSSYKKKIRKERSRSAADWLELYSPDVATTAVGPIGRMVRGSRCEEQARSRAATNGAWLRRKRSSRISPRQAAPPGNKAVRRQRLSVMRLFDSTNSAAKEKR